MSLCPRWRNKIYLFNGNSKERQQRRNINFTLSLIVITQVNIDLVDQLCTIVDYCFYYYYYWKRLAMQGWETAINTLSVRRPKPHNTIHRRKEEKGKNSRRQKGSELLGQQKRIGPTLETRQSHIIEHRVTKIVPERYREGNKSPAVLRDSAARRCIRKPMCDQSTTCNPHWHIRPR